jgi:hypothetical protein
VIKGKIKLQTMLTWNQKNVNFTHNNVVASNLNNFNFFNFFFVKVGLRKYNHILFFSTRYHDCPKIRIPHVVHLANQH